MNCWRWCTGTPGDRYNREIAAGHYVGKTIGITGGHLAGAEMAAGLSQAFRAGVSEAFVAGPDRYFPRAIVFSAHCLSWGMIFPGAPK